MLINLVIENKNETLEIGDHITTVETLKKEIQSKFNIQITMIKCQNNFLMDFQELKSLGIQQNSVFTVLSQFSNQPQMIPKLQQIPQNKIIQLNQQPISIPQNQPIKLINPNNNPMPQSNPIPPITFINQIPNPITPTNQPNPIQTPIGPTIFQTNELTPYIQNNQKELGSSNTNNNFSNNNQYPPMMNNNQMNPPNYMNLNQGNNFQQNQQMDPINTLQPPMNVFNQPQQMFNQYQNYGIPMNTQQQINQNTMNTQQANMKKELEDKISELEKENKQQKKEIRELTSENETQKDKLKQQLQSENIRFNKKKDELEMKIDSEIRELKRSKEKLELENTELTAKVEKLKNDLQEANLNLIGQNDKRLNTGINYTQLLEDKDSNISKLKKDIEMLQNELFQVKTQKADFETQYTKSLHNLESEYKDKFEKQERENEQLKQQYKNNKKVIDDFQVESDKLQLENTKLKQNNYILEQQQKNDQITVNDLQEQLQNQQKYYNQIKEALFKESQNTNQSEYYKNLLKDQEQLINQQRLNAQKIKQDLENDMKQKQYLIQLKEKEEQQIKIFRKKKEQYLKVDIQKKQGTLEICFLLDITGSMDHYKEQTMKSIITTVQNVKNETNRDIKWAVVAYQDYDEQIKLGGKYQQLKFTNDSSLILSFVNQLKCTGGGDEAEDLAGGIDQMITQLDWNADYRLAILITDAPCHGTKFNGGDVNDNYKKEDISENLDKIIEKRIVFLTIDFTKKTQFMTQKMQEYFESQKKGNYYIKTNLVNAQQSNLWQELQKLISRTTQQLTQVNNSSTQTKGGDKNVLGALEAMSKVPSDPFQFDKLNPNDNIACKFTILRVEIKQDKLEKIEDLLLITNNDYEFIKEGNWDCVRTKNPFAKGQMKAVYLMKELKQDHLYVIKTPLGKRAYLDQNQALVDMKGHLISKVLMAKFMKLVNEKKDKLDFEIPNIVYSDFLILQDNSNFWIAERYFKGEFVKYNNNFGYINQKDSTINQLAQAFSYFTYQQSNFNYLIVDVQGVGNYFTDPAINSNTGNFDETDMGLKGQGQFMVTFEQYKNKIRKILKVLEMNDD